MRPGCNPGQRRRPPAAETFHYRDSETPPILEQVRGSRNASVAFLTISELARVPTAGDAFGPGQARLRATAPSERVAIVMIGAWLLCGSIAGSIWRQRRLG